MTATATKEPQQAADFVVVGAGPVGLLTAILLGRKGWRVTVVERWPSRYPMPRACTIDHESLRILQSAGVMAEHADLFEPSRGERGGYQIRNQDGVLLQAINWNRTAESGWANTNGFYQPDLESVLEQMASDIPSVEIRRGWSAEAISQSGSSVTLDLSSFDTDARESITGKWLIGADGANSAVRDLVGIETEDAGFAADWLVVDYEPLDVEEWDAFVTQFCDPEQPATAVNSGPGRRRFEFMRRDDITAEELGRTETAWRLMAPWGVTPETARLERHAVYTFRGQWARDWRRGRVLIAGDAAHLMPPFLGQGMCSGLRDAAALAWRLGLVESGLADEGILDSYGTERSTHVREIIDEAIAIGRVICELDPVRAAERDAAMLAELTDPAAVTVEPPHPRLGSPSITADGDGNAGRLSVQGRVEVDGSVGLFDDLVGGDWQLIALGDDPLATVPSDLAEWFASIGGTATGISAAGCVHDVDGTYASWFAANDCSVVLSRPDFYIFGTAPARGAEGLLRGLRSGLATPDILLGPSQHQYLSRRSAIMTMRVTRIADAEPFAPVGHAGVGPVRLQGGSKTPTEKFTVVLSHYLPGAAAELAPQEAETVYVMLAGELVMAADGLEETLRVNDSVHYTAGTMRTVENRTHLPASMLVIRAIQ